MGFIDGPMDRERLQIAFASGTLKAIDFSAVPHADRPALARILQQTVDRLGDEGWSPEREEAVMRDLLRQHMRGLIGDAAWRKGTAR